jgi:hypothetical protein
MRRGRKEWKGNTGIALDVMVMAGSLVAERLRMLCIS